MTDHFRKIDIDAFDDDQVRPEDLYEPDPRSPQQALQEASAKESQVRGHLSRRASCVLLVPGRLLKRPGDRKAEATSLLPSPSFSPTLRTGLMSKKPRYFCVLDFRDFNAFRMK